MIKYNGHQINITEHLRDSNTKFAIIIPGFLDTKDYPHLTMLSEELHNLGYDVVSFDPIGTWNSKGDIKDYTITNYIEQIQLVHDHYSTNKDYSAHIIAGHSLGGRVSILAGTITNASAVIAIMAPHSSQRQDNQAKIQKWRDTGFRESTRDDPNSDEIRSFKTPINFLDDSSKHDTLQAVKKLNCPVLFVVGELDETVTPESTKILFDEANEPKEMIVLDGVGHGYRRYPEQVSLVNNRIIKFLKNHQLA